MKAPLCSICDHNHYSYQSHVFQAVTDVTTERNQIVTKPVTCNQCVTKDAEIQRLRNQLLVAEQRATEWAKVSVEIDQNHRKKAKRDRAEYMKKYRADHKPLGIPYG